MIYLKKKIRNEAVLGIWYMEENESQLRALLSEDYISDIISIKSQHIRQEKLAVRCLLKNLLGYEKVIHYTSHGKPYFIDQTFNISISHTKDYVAILLDSHYPVGVDIESISERILKLRKRIIPEGTYIDPELEVVHLLLHWSARETLFKVMAETDIDFRSHLHIEDFKPSECGLLSAFETKTLSQRQFKIDYLVTNAFVLTYTQDCTSRI